MIDLVTTGRLRQIGDLRKVNVSAAGRADRQIAAFRDLVAAIGVEQRDGVEKSMSNIISPTTSPP